MRYDVDAISTIDQPMRAAPLTTPPLSPLQATLLKALVATQRLPQVKTQASRKTRSAMTFTWTTTA